MKWSGEGIGSLDLGATRSRTAEVGGVEGCVFAAHERGLAAGQGDQVLCLEHDGVLSGRGSTP